MDRRRLLRWLVDCGSAIVAAIVGIPALLAALSPAIKGRSGQMWRPIGPLEEFPINEVVKALVRKPSLPWARSLEAEAVYVWRVSAEESVVYSRNCTDLSCPVNWDPGSECFYCPCHGGIFAKDGEPMAGPPPRPLYRYAHRLKNGVLEIDLYSLPAMT